MKSIGEKIREARLVRGLSQDELAKLSGYGSRASINKIELGKVDPPRSKLNAIAKALHVDPAWLLGLSERRDMIYMDEKMGPILIEAQDATEAQIEQAARYLAYLKSLDKIKK